MRRFSIFLPTMAMVGCLIVFVAQNSFAQARLDFATSKSTISAYSTSMVQDPVTIPCPPLETISDNQSGFTTLPTGRIYGGAFTYIKRGLPNCKISSQGTANFLVDGDGTNVIYARWWCHSNTQYDCYDPNCAWTATDSSSVNASVKIAIDGLPQGTPVQVTYFWRHFSSFANDPEAGTEDEAAVAGAYLNLFNQVGFGGNMNVGGAAKFFQRRTGADPVTLNTLVGDTLQIDVRAMTHANIDPPAKPIPNPSEDDASSDFFGYCIIYVNGPNSPVVSATDTCDHQSILYSIDIGSDAEISDPTPDGNELLDPGDIYDDQAISPVPLFDDFTIFGFDPNPSVGNPAGTCLPGPDQSSQHVLNFDIDGIDRIDYDFYNQAGTYGQGLPSIQQFTTECIHSPLYAMFSFDEDRGINFNSAVNCNVPSAFDPVDSTYVRGTVDGHDEVMIGNLYQSQGLNQYTGVAMPYKNEDELSALLVPAPISRYPADLNDDVDALDLVSDAATCGIQYFSVDHEAQYTYGNDTLDPGAIYQVVSPGVLENVIDPVLHLGLLPDTDIDAFEFTWLYDIANQRYGLALAFSVSDSDPFALEDYTGGLDSDFIYASFLDGVFFEMVGSVLPSNIDGLAFACEALIANGSEFEDPTILVGLNSQFEEQIAVEIYPNPNAGSFSLNLQTNIDGPTELRLYDFAGKLVWSENRGSLVSGNHQIQIPKNLTSNGVYIFELRATESGLSTRKRVSILK